MDKKKIQNGIPGEGLDEFIGEFRFIAKDFPFTTWLILPTERLVRTVHRKLGADEVPYIPTRICTLQNFCKDYFEAHRTTSRLLSTAESRLLLNQVLVKHEGELPVFFSKGRPSSGTVDDLILFMNVMIRRKIGFPECLLDLQGAKSDQINLIITSYRNQLRDSDLVDPDTLLEWVLDRIASSDSDLGNILIYGIFDPAPLERDLLYAICNRSLRCLVFSPDGKDQDIFNRKWIGENGVPRSPGSPVSESLTGIFSLKDRIETQEFLRASTISTRYQEIESIAEEIARLHDDGLAYSDIAVALPDVRGQLPVIEEVFTDFNVPWDSAAGKKLNGFPIVGFLLDLLEVVNARFPRDAVIRIVNSPYFRRNEISLISREIDVISRLAQIEEGKEQWVDGLNRYLARISTEEKDIPEKVTVERVIHGVAQLFEDLRLLEGRKTLEEHGRALADIMGRWYLRELPGTSDEIIRQEELVGIEAFRKCCETIDRMAGLLPPGKINTGEFLSILSALVRDYEVPISGNVGGVTVLGIRECAHEHFPIIFLAGLTEGEMPRLTTRLPFFNTLENVRMGTRSLDDILREERYYFLAALLAGRDRVYLSAPLSDGENMLLTSAFFERVCEKTAAIPWGDLILTHSHRGESTMAGENISSGKVCESLEHLPADQSIEEIVNRINIERFYRQGEYNSRYEGVLSSDPAICSALSVMYGPDHIYSPTVLETYAECPFRFFIERVANMRPLPEVEPNLSAKDRGTAVHNVLSRFYREWLAAGHGKVTGISLTLATDLMLRIATEELGKYSFASPLWEATRVQMTGGEHTGPGIFVQFLKQESREEASPLIPSLFELSFGMVPASGDDPASVPEPVSLSSGEEPIRIKGRIDRIDVTPDGHFIICDYKTGSALVSRKEIEAGKALQLPFYLAAYEAISGLKGVAAGYYRIRREVENRIVLCDETGKELILSARPRVTDLRKILQDSQTRATEYICRIREGNFPLIAAEKCPNPYCDFRFVCRFDPARVFSLPEVEE